MTDNYYSDHRVRAAETPSWCTSLDMKTMRATVELYDPAPEVAALDPEYTADCEYCIVSVPVCFDVCPTCNGRGSHVNPSIDCDGLSAEDFAEDPDFAEDYVQGFYDVPCYGCHGRNVVPSLDRKRTPAAVVAAIDSQRDFAADYAAECAAERRMGA